MYASMHAAGGSASSKQRRDLIFYFRARAGLPASRVRAPGALFLLEEEKCRRDQRCT